MSSQAATHKLRFKLASQGLKDLLYLVRLAFIKDNFLIYRKNTVME